MRTTKKHETAGMPSKGLEESHSLEHIPQTYQGIEQTTNLTSLKECRSTEYYYADMSLLQSVNA